RHGAQHGEAARPRQASRQGLPARRTGRYCPALATRNDPLPVTPIMRAALWMAGWLAAMLTLSVSGRELTAELPVFVLMLWRSCLGVLFIAPFILWAGGRPLRTTRIRWHMMRNLTHYSAQYCWFL